MAKMYNAAVVKLIIGCAEKCDCHIAAPHSNPPGSSDVMSDHTCNWCKQCSRHVQTRTRPHNDKMRPRMGRVSTSILRMQTWMQFLMFLRMRMRTFPQKNKFIYRNSPTF